MPWCMLLTGMPNSGKSTIAYHLVQKVVRNALVIDGDRHREMQFLGHKLGFTEEDILENTEHVIKLARFAQDQKFNVLIPQIAPFREQRHRMRAQLDGFLEILCQCTDEERASRPNFRDSELVYEQGGHDLVVDTGSLTAEASVESIIRYFGIGSGDST